MATKLEELRAEEARLRAAYQAAENARRIAEREASAKAAEFERELLEKVRLEHEPKTRAAWLAFYPVEAAAAAEAVRAAEAGENLPHPLGTVFARWHGCEWKRGEDGKDGGFTSYRRSDERAVLEVFRQGDTVRPSNQTRGMYDPKPGDLVLRDLKKNGKPGVTCRKFDPVNLLWLPEGVEHPQARA